MVQQDETAAGRLARTGFRLEPEPGLWRVYRVTHEDDEGWYSGIPVLNLPGTLAREDAARWACRALEARGMLKRGDHSLEYAGGTVSAVPGFPEERRPLRWWVMVACLGFLAVWAGWRLMILVFTVMESWR